MEYVSKCPTKNAKGLPCRSCEMGLCLLYNATELSLDDAVVLRGGFDNGIILLQKGGALMYWKKMIAPIIITLLLGIYLIIYAVALVSAIPELWMKLLAGLIPLALLGASIYNLYERIQEIRSGEEDDLSKY